MIHKMRLARLRVLSALCILGSLTACSVGPDYVRPDMEVPQAYKETGNWKPAEPADTRSRGKWWEIYGDATLNDLIEQANARNQDIQAELATYRQARAAAQAARAGFLPTLDASAGASRSRSSSKVGNSFNLGLDASWEADLWGKVARDVEASEATMQADVATVAATRLSTQASLAQDYFQLRVTDATIALQKETLANYERALQITRNQLAVGIVTRADVASAQTQLKSTQAALIDLGVTRAQLEHAIAILIGKPPASFGLPASTSPEYAANLPELPAELPSALLERRPDVAAAERKVAAANAQIGVAQAAFYPSLGLSTSGGYQGSRLGDLFDVPGRVWSLGASLAGSLYDGGLRRAQKQEAIANYDATVAQYRQTVLGAFQDVEDNLVALQLLADEARVQDEAVQAALEAQRLAMDQYKAGTAVYSSVIVAQASANSAQRTAMTLLGRRYSAHVLLIKALGGDWLPGQAAATP
jgi:NodT family efflux transporter outer membrane factor (OMF) lipoprotein